MNKQTALRKARSVASLALGTALSVATPSLGVLAAGGLTFGYFSQTAHAQDKTTVRRTVEGKVHDKNDAIIKGAVVYIKDTRTLAVKSFLSDDEGTFHFGQLSTNADYEVYAEFEGKRSKSKTISSFDSKTSFNFVLKIDTSKGQNGRSDS